MKLRIAVGLAAVVLVASIGAWIWVGSDSVGPGAAPPPAERPPQIPPIDGAAARTADPIPLPRPDSTTVPSSVPRPVVQMNRPGGKVPPGPLPVPDSRPASPPRPAPGVPPAVAPKVSAPPAFANPEISEKVAADIDRVGLMLRDFRTRMGENPFGTNAEIMKAVMGGNPKQARLGPPEGQTLNGDGELVDRWGTPYFFHQMSRNDMEIRSAGPDRKMGTDDDVVGR